MSGQGAVYLYCAVGRAEQFLPVRRSLRGKLQIGVSRLIDSLLWRLLRIWRFEHWRYEDVHFSNVGDIAIGEACIQLVARHIAEGAPIRTVTWGYLDAKLVDEINRDGLAFFVAGGGYFVFDDRWRIGRRASDDAPLFAAIRVPKFMFAIGVNNPELRSVPTSRVALDPSADRAIGGILASFDGVSVRDELSRAILQPLTASRIDVVPDPALFLEPLRKAPAPADVSGRVGLNFALHSDIAEALFRKNFWVYVNALKAYQAETGCAFFYFVHSDAENKAAQLLADEGVRLTKLRGGPTELLDHYGTMSFHVCQMLHSSILATAAGCPSLSIAYDVKSFGFYRMMDLERQCISAEGVTTEQIQRAMRATESEQHRIRSLIVERRRCLKQQVMANLDQLKAIAAVPS